MIDPTLSQTILSQIQSSKNSGFALRSQAMSLLDQLEGYDWSGVYRLEGQWLVLDAFQGEPTDHTRIEVGVGVCGTAVAEQTNQVVKDVRLLDNYLACSVSTRSEIVVLIKDAMGGILGQIDIDGHQVGAFSKEDEAFLEALASLLANRWL